MKEIETKLYNSLNFLSVTLLTLIFCKKIYLKGIILILSAMNLCHKKHRLFQPTFSRLVFKTFVKKLQKNRIDLKI